MTDITQAVIDLVATCRDIIKYTDCRPTRSLTIIREYDPEGKVLAAAERLGAAFQNSIDKFIPDSEYMGNVAPNIQSEHIRYFHNIRHNGMALFFKLDITPLGDIMYAQIISLSIRPVDCRLDAEAYRARQFGILGINDDPKLSDNLIKSLITEANNTVPNMLVEFKDMYFKVISTKSANQIVLDRKFEQAKEYWKYYVETKKYLSKLKN